MEGGSLLVAFLVLAIMAASVAAASPSPPQILVVNSGRIDYDGAIDWHVLGEKVVTHAKDPRGDGDFIERLETCPQAVEVIVTKEIPVSAAVVRRLPKSVKLLVEAGTGYNNIALDECRKRGIIVMNVPAYSSDSVATLVMTFLLNLSSSLHRQLRRLGRGDRADFVQHLQNPHFELRGKTLGLVGGTGGIGSRVKEFARAFGMRVLISTRRLREDEDGGLVAYTDSLTQLLSESDFVSLHCPLNEATRNLIDAEALRAMKPTAFLINTARGGLCDEEALIQALQDGTIAGAALDVQVEEPPGENSPLYTLENVIITPHIGWKRKETREALVARVAENIVGFCEGDPQNVVS